MLWGGCFFRNYIYHIKFSRFCRQNLILKFLLFCSQFSVRYFKYFLFVLKLFAKKSSFCFLSFCRQNPFSLFCFSLFCRQNSIFTILLFKFPLFKFLSAKCNFWDSNFFYAQTNRFLFFSRFISAQLPHNVLQLHAGREFTR